MSRSNEYVSQMGEMPSISRSITSSSILTTEDTLMVLEFAIMFQSV